MADQKVSQLTAATTPLAGTELAYVVQGGNSRRTTVAAISATAPGTDLTFTQATSTLASSTGADVVLPVATPAQAGLESAADKTKLDSITVDSATLTRIYVRNNSGVDIAKGQPCYQTGSSGTTITVALADASSEATAAQTLGLAQEAIAHNANGYLVAVGELAGLNTSALTEGQIVWLSETTGALTTTRPTQPAHGVVCGYCIKQGSGTSGILYVKVDNGQELDELHDVLITSPTTGQVLRRSATGLWQNAQLDVADVSGALSATTAASTYQPLDSDLTAIAALSTTAFGRSLLTQADGTATRATIGAGTVTGVTGSGLITSTGGAAPVISTSMATDRLLGRSTAGTGAVEEIIIGSGLSLSAGTLTATGGGGGSGTVTSVGLSLPALFTVTGSPVTTSGTLTATLATQAANLVFAGPTSGAAAAPAFRALVAGDLPATSVTAGSYGSASQVGSFTVDAAGRLTAAASTSISIAATAISDSTVTGRALLTAADAAAGRSTLSAAASGAIGSSGLTMASARLLGRTTASTGAPEEITVGSGLSLSAGTLTATGGGGGEYSFAGYATGNWIQPAVGTVGAGTANAVNTVYLYPFEVRRSITVNELGARVTSAMASSNFQLAIYASSSGLPTGTPLAATGNLSGTTLGTVSGAVTAFNLTAGNLYWAAFNCDVGVTMQQLFASNSYFVSVIGTSSLAEVSSAAAQSAFTRIVSSTFGTWPDLTSATTTVQTGTALRGAVTYLKVSAFL